MTFKSLLQEFDKTLKTCNPVEYAKLQPPLSDDEIDMHLHELGINDNNVKELYKWKNGGTPNYFCKIIDFGSLVSLESIKENRMFDKYYDPAFIELITENGEDSFLFNTTPGDHYGKLYFYSVGLLYIDHPISYFDSLECMVETVIEAYKNGIFKYDFEENWLEIDYKRYCTLCTSINKNSAFWTEHNVLKWEEWYEI